MDLIYGFFENFPILSWGLLWLLTMLPSFHMYEKYGPKFGLNELVEEHGLNVLSITLFLITIFWPIILGIAIYKEHKGED